MYYSGFHFLFHYPRITPINLHAASTIPRVMVAAGTQGSDAYRDYIGIMDKKMETTVGFRVCGLGFRVWGLGFRIQTFLASTLATAPSLNV